MRPIVERLVSVHDLALWDVEYLREAGRETLRVSVDRAGGVDAEALRSLSEDLSRELDEHDPVPGDSRYWLEVTSPGAERKLRAPEQFDICRGRLARLTFKDGRQPLTGAIAAVDPEAVMIAAPDGAIRVGFEEISQARLQVPGV